MSDDKQTWTGENYEISSVSDIVTMPDGPFNRLMDEIPDLLRATRENIKQQIGDHDLGEIKLHVVALWEDGDPNIPTSTGVLQAATPEDAERLAEVVTKVKSRIASDIMDHLDD